MSSAWGNVTQDKCVPLGGVGRERCREGLDHGQLFLEGCWIWRLGSQRHGYQVKKPLLCGASFFLGLILYKIGEAVFLLWNYFELSLKFALPCFAVITFSNIWWPTMSLRQPLLWCLWQNLTSSFRNHPVLIFLVSWEPLLNSGIKFSRTGLQGKEFTHILWQLLSDRYLLIIGFYWNMCITFLLQWFWGNFSTASLAVHRTPSVSNCWLKSTSQCSWDI